MPHRHLSCIVLPVATLCFGLPIVGQNATGAGAAEPAMQLPPDQAAFKAANGIVDKQQRATALEAFVHDYPTSKRVSSARTILLDLLLEQQPLDEHRIHAVAVARVKNASKDDRAHAEDSVAYALAEAPPNGVDLKSAEHWSRDSVKQSTYDKFAAMIKASYAAAKEPLPSDALVHAMYGESQAGRLQTLADVYFHEGKLAEATSALDQAEALQPNVGAVWASRGQVAHAQGHDDQALDDLEAAEVYGGMTAATHALLDQLYTAKHGGSRDGLDAEIDRRYTKAYPPNAAVQHTASPSGRTVLVELYTGSACPPCIAADLSLDGVLRNYARTDVVALALDQHIPEPDPLANAATVARADYHGVHFTPTFRIDGVEGPGVYGRQRSDVAKAYATLSTAIDKQLSVPSGAVLKLTASLTGEHTVKTSANFQVTDADALRKLLASKPDAKSDGTKPDAAKSDAAKTAAAEAATPREPRLVMNFALVQKEVRYSGENGVRFHSMVVRDLAKPAKDGFPVELAGGSSASYLFDPAAVSAGLSKYLVDFAQHNDRFGAPHFLTTDTALPLNDLAVAAWVEDLTTHQVVAAAFTSLEDGQATERASR